MGDAVLDDLKMQIAAGRAVLVVGSGASVAATGNAPAASWTGLLRLGIERCTTLDASLDRHWQERTLADVESGRLEDLLSAATKVRGILRRHNEWARWLADTVGELRPSRFELLDALDGLQAPIVTTNYDDVMDRHLRRHPITWQSTTEQIAFARLESRETLLHLHGFWREPDTVILDGGDYARVMGAEVVQASLRTLAEAFSLVFIGCGDGLADPNFEQFIDWLGTVLRDARHRLFRLERRADVERRQAWHLARQDKVRVLSFGDAHEELSTFIQSLRPEGASLLTAAVRRTEEGPLQPSPPPRPVLSAGEYLRLQAKGRDAIARLTALGQRLGWASIAALGTELAGTLEQDLYRVAITGRSRAGKSTLVNALVGRALCPVERILTTAIPIVIGPGERESATITFEDVRKQPVQFDGPITADMLAPYADQRHNEGNRKGVERIDVRLGHQVLDLGVEYVDIPGFDDPNGRIWRATHATINRSHALVMVLDVSTFDSGGFALDSATRQVLECAQARGCPVLVVCNKSDKLTRKDRDEAARYLRERLAAHGVEGAVPHAPFFVSAKDAADARIRGDAHSAGFAMFDAALWSQLWNTEAVGLRRLFKVFDALRVADDEVSALIAAREAQGPDRDHLRDAVDQARADHSSILATFRRECDDTARHAVAAALAAGEKYLRVVEEHVAALPADAELPTVSATIEALHERFRAGCWAVVEQVAPALTLSADRAERAVARSLSTLRSGAGLPTRTEEARAVLRALDGWSSSIELPDTGTGKRRFKIGAAGTVAGGAVLATLGGPLGWLFAIGVGTGISALVGHFTNRAGSRSDLLHKVKKHTEMEFAKFRASLQEALSASTTRVATRIQQRMQLFLSDMESRLDSIREPTADERRWHLEMHGTVVDALAALTTVLGPQTGNENATPPSPV